jgi:hypothetical protein
MAASYLIDGYNLLHFLDLFPPRLLSLDKARQHLLTLLRRGHGEESSSVTVIFDASAAPPGATLETEFHGIRVRFAQKHGSADEMIEELIREAPAPHQVTVVSNDHRIQAAGRRRHCTVLGCGDYLDRLREQPPGVPPAPPPPEKPAPADTAFWLREFADLDNDPALWELSDPPFDDPPSGA